MVSAMRIRTLATALAISLVCSLSAAADSKALIETHESEAEELKAALADAESFIDDL